jgi:hypothetical protein
MDGLCQVPAFCSKVDVGESCQGFMGQLRGSIPATEFLLRHRTKYIFQ